LTNEQLEYAVQDVTYLPALYENSWKNCIAGIWDKRQKRPLTKLPPALAGKRMTAGTHKNQRLLLPKSRAKRIIQEALRLALPASQRRKRAIFMFLPIKTCWKSRKHRNIEEYLCSKN